MSSADPGDDEQPAGGAGAPPAEEITDPDLAAEVDNPADSNAPTGAAAPGGDSTAADDAPVPAPGAPGALSSDQAPAQGEQRGVATPAQPLGEEAAGEAAGVEAGPDDATAGGKAAPDDADADGADDANAAVPEQPPSTPVAAAEGSGVERAVAAKIVEADQAAEVADNSEAPPPGEEDPTPAQVDHARQRLIDTLRASLSDAVVGAHVLAGTDAWVRVRADAWRQAAEVCRDELGLTYFCYLSAIDWLPSPYGRSEDAGDDDNGDAGAAPDGPAELEHGYAGGETRFQLLARYVSPTTFVGLTLKADLDDDEPRAPTVSDVYAGADWHEREAWEMYGIDFEGHPHLVHLYLPGAFEGHPQRKDFPLLAREVKPWPGLVDVEAMPGEVEAGDGAAS